MRSGEFGMNATLTATYNGFVASLALGRLPGLQGAGRPLDMSPGHKPFNPPADVIDVEVVNVEDPRQESASQFSAQPKQQQTAPQNILPQPAVYTRPRARGQAPQLQYRTGQPGQFLDVLA